MNFLIDENIPLANEVFGMHGNVHRFAGRLPDPRVLAQAEVLLVRSVTRVDAALLDKTRHLKFVGTATIGTEHIDTQALDKLSVPFASAPGANADSVGEYVLTALLALGRKQNRSLRGLSVAVVGAGNTGTATGRRLSALGMKVGYFDPPRQQREKGFTSLSWEEVTRADVITVHVPLVKEGADATWHMFDEQVLRQLTNEQTLVNSSRGSVIDNKALLERQQKSPLTLILDVWEGEPEVLVPLMEKTALATPHIAGYSINGKVRGTQMLYDACARHFGWNSDPKWDELVPVPAPTHWQCGEQVDEQQITDWVLENYPIWRDDQNMRRCGDTAQGFDRLRKEYPVRYELLSHFISSPTTMPKQEHNRLRTLGFNL